MSTNTIAALLNGPHLRIVSLIGVPLLGGQGMGKYRKIILVDDVS